MAHHLILPAGGKGARFGSGIPKQYRQLQGIPLIEISLRQLTGLMDFATVAVGMADTVHWRPGSAIARVPGGESRAQTVFNLVQSLSGVAAENDWVWVHDAVRPCVSRGLIDRISAALSADVDAVVPGLPATDTLKQVNAENRVVTTLDRSTVRCAQTPQVCRYGLLRQALEMAVARGMDTTDESSAMELAGHRVLMVEGDEVNIKVTRPGDLARAELLYMGVRVE